MLSFQILPELYSIHRFSADAVLPTAVWSSPFLSITKHDTELSIVCASSISLESNQVESDWRAMQVVGPLDFGLTGILAKIATILADANISIFAISTYDTDYILVKADRLADAKAVLSAKQYQFLLDE